MVVEGSRLLTYTEATEAKTGFVHVTSTSNAVMETTRFLSTLVILFGRRESRLGERNLLEPAVTDSMTYDST
jgi:hypothetical protein